MSALSVRTVRGHTIPESLVREWWSLWQRCSDTTPFQSPAWLVHWWNAFAPGELVLVCVYAGDELVGLAPSYIEHAGRSQRTLPLGIAISDYLDVLIDPSCSDAVAAALMHAIAEHTITCASWEFTELAPWAAGLHLPLPSYCAEERGVSNVCLTVAIPPHATSMRAFVPGHRLQAMRTAWNRMRRTGNPELVIGDRSNAHELFVALVSLHATRWQHLQSGGVLMDSRVLRFHHAAIPALESAGLLRLFALRYEDRYIGVYYGLHHERRAYAYLIGFDVAYEAFSPGNVLFAHAIDTAVKEHAEEFDFLRGNERYKYLWGARERENARRVIRRKPVREVMRA